MSNKKKEEENKVSSNIGEPVVLMTLRVTNFAIISEMEITFEEGLNIISGETGAGKSILVGAVNLLLGGRASPELIKTGAEEAHVEGIFEVSGLSSMLRRLQEFSLDSGNELLVSRTVSRTGRNRVRINGTLSTVSTLGKITSGLASISGQHEHQKLLDPETHLEILDDYGQLSGLLREYQKLYVDFEQLRKKLKILEDDSRNKERQLDFLKFQIREIENAKLEPGEEEALMRERSILKHAEQLFSASKESYELLYAQQGSVLDKLDLVKKYVRDLSSIDPGTKDLHEIVEQVSIQLTDLAYSLRDYKEQIEFNPDRLGHIENRLHQIQRITKKYGGDTKSTLEYLSRLKENVAALENTHVFIEETRSELGKRTSELLEVARALSAKRKVAASRFTREVGTNLRELGMPHAALEVNFNKLPEGEFAATGTDVVEFYFSANPGETAKPLARVASGGELSRILLAFKVVNTNTRSRETLIFDEVDTGIGGKTASLLGKMLSEISKRQQVICITHLPQIACYGKCHFSVRKEVIQNKTDTYIRKLSEQERESEIARMLGGITISEKTLAHAKELLKTNL